VIVGLHAQQERLKQLEDVNVILLRPYLSSRTSTARST
jgi:hypothetical protein